MVLTMILHMVRNFRRYFVVARNRCFIMLTCPFYVEPHTAHVYIVKMGFTGVYIMFLKFALKCRRKMQLKAY